MERSHVLECWLYIQQLFFSINQVSTVLMFASLDSTTCCHAAVLLDLKQLPGSQGQNCTYSDYAT